MFVSQVGMLFFQDAVALLSGRSQVLATHLLQVV
jgi:hypothetical protein